MVMVVGKGWNGNGVVLVIELVVSEGDDGQDGWRGQIRPESPE